VAKAARRRKLPVSVEFVRERLLPLYGPINWKPRYNALDELIFTVLTQHTSDLNAERAFASLRDRWDRWEGVIAAPPTDVADAIKSGGLANQKSVRIQKILQVVLDRHGSLELEWLAERSLEEARSWLTELPGVGPKTAAVVMSFSLRMPAFPVDTHIHRVSKRLGFISAKTSADDAHPMMESIVPPEQRFDFHVLLITHGRRICKAQRPLCGECPLAAECPSSLAPHRDS
jgi:endonuclease-3